MHLVDYNPLCCFVVVSKTLLSFVFFFFFFFNIMDGDSVNFLKTCLLYGSSWQTRCCKTITGICPSLEGLMHFGGMTVVNTNLVILGMWGAHACGGSACIHSWGG